MKRLACFCAGLMWACAGDPSATGPHEKPIIGGTLDLGDPSVVALFGHLPGDASFGQICSGVVASPHVIVTAAHCVDPRYYAYAFSTVGTSFVIDVFTVNDLNAVGWTGGLPTRAFSHDHPDLRSTRATVPGQGITRRRAAQPAQPRCGSGRGRVLGRTRVVGRGRLVWHGRGRLLRPHHDHGVRDRPRLPNRPNGDRRDAHPERLRSARAPWPPAPSLNAAAATYARVRRRGPDPSRMPKKKTPAIPFQPPLPAPATAQEPLSGFGPPPPDGGPASGPDVRPSAAASGGGAGRASGPASGCDPPPASGPPGTSGRIWIPFSAAPLAASAPGTIPEWDPRKPAEAIWRMG